MKKALFTMFALVLFLGIGFGNHAFAGFCTPTCNQVNYNNYGYSNYGYNNYNNYSNYNSGYNNYNYGYSNSCAFNCSTGSYYGNTGYTYPYYNNSQYSYPNYSYSNYGYTPYSYASNYYPVNSVYIVPANSVYGTYNQYYNGYNSANIYGNNGSFGIGIGFSWNS